MWHLKTVCTILMLCGPHGHFNKSAVALTLSGQFDAATTYHLLNSNTNTHEVNPLLRPVAARPVIFPTMFGLNLLELYAARSFDRRGHHRIALWIRLAGAADHVACGIHNLKIQNYTPEEAKWHLHPLP